MGYSIDFLENNTPIIDGWKFTDSDFKNEYSTRDYLVALNNNKNNNSKLIVVLSNPSYAGHLNGGKCYYVSDASLNRILEAFKDEYYEILFLNIFNKIGSNPSEIDDNYMTNLDDIKAKVDEFENSDLFLGFGNDIKSKTVRKNRKKEFLDDGKIKETYTQHTIPEIKKEEAIKKIMNFIMKNQHNKIFAFGLTNDGRPSHPSPSTKMANKSVVELIKMKREIKPKIKNDYNKWEFVN